MGITKSLSTYWHANRYPRLFSECGLENISIHPIASGFAYNDNYWSDEYRMKKLSYQKNDAVTFVLNIKIHLTGNRHITWISAKFNPDPTEA